MIPPRASKRAPYAGPFRAHRAWVAVACALCACSNGAPEATRNTAPDGASHEKYFPIGPSDPHALGKTLAGSAVPVDCNTCHGQAQTFKQFDCLGCHAATPTDGEHFGNPDYQWKSLDCYRCHARGTLSTTLEAHAARFPIGAGASHQFGKRLDLGNGAGAAAVACASCHQQWVKPDPTAGWVLSSSVTCTTCHTAAGTNAAGPPPVDLGPAHAGKVAGASWQAQGAGPTTNCLQCHAADLNERVAAHGSGTAAFPSDAPGEPFVIGSGSHFVSCESCHGAAAAPAGLKNPRLDFAARTCTACHSEAKDKLVSTHGLLSVAISDPADPSGAPLAGHARQCLSCHPTGEAATSDKRFTHPIFPVGAGSKHQLGAPEKYLPGKFACASCHTALGSDPQQVDCTGCHTARQLTGVTGASPVTFSFHEAVPDLVWPRPAAPQATSLLCLKCHDHAQLPAQVLHSDHSERGVHGPGSATIRFDVTAGARHEMAGSGGVACFTCHASSGPSSPPVAGLAFADFKQRTCTACHAPAGKLAQDLDALHAGTGALAQAYTKLPAGTPLPAHSETCAACHASGDIDPAQAVQVHARFFPIGAADSHGLGRVVALPGASLQIACATCHQDKQVKSNVTCTGCHTAAGANAAGPAPIDLGPAHQGKLAGSSWKAAGAGPTPQCLQCHTGDFNERVAVHGQGTAAFPADVKNPAVAFVISSGDANHFAACESCHTQQAAADPVLKSPRLDFAARSCNGCHSEAKDRIVTNHAPLGLAKAVGDTVDALGAPVAGHAKACLECHPNGGAAPATVQWKHPLFPVSAGKHALGALVEPTTPAAGIFQCASCHTALTSDASQVDCTGCHTQQKMTRAGVSFHAAVPDLVWPATPAPQATSLLCLKCHLEQTGPGAPAGAIIPAQVSYSTHSAFGVHSSVGAIAFDVTAGKAHDSASSKRPMACLTCHATTTATTPAIAGLAVADFSQRTCTACHAPAGSLQENLDGIHAGMTTPSPGYANLPAGAAPPAYSQTCVLCHPHGQTDAAQATAAHAPYFPIGAADSHALGRAVLAAGKPVTVTCATCHTDATAREVVTCTACHTPAGTNAAGPGAIDLGPAHQGKLAGVSWKATGAGPTPQCLRCHSGDFNERVAVHGQGTTAFPADVKNPAATFVITSGDVNHFTACESCHTQQAAVDPVLKNPRLDFAARSCNGCHTEAKDRVVTNHAPLGLTKAVGDTVDARGAPVAGHAKACLECHPNGGAAPATVQWKHPIFPVGAGSVHALGAPAVHAAGSFTCTTCHTALGTDAAQVDCTGCHTKAQMTTSGGASFHAAVPDLSWPASPAPQATSLVCLRCHADSKVPAQVSYSSHSTAGRHSPANAAISFDVTAGAPHDAAAPGRAMACLGCHTSASATTPPVAGLLVTDFTKRTCTACHAPAGSLAQDLDGLHTGVWPQDPAGTPGYTPLPSAAPPASFSQTCATCHPNGQIDAAQVVAHHAPFFPVGSGDSHAYGRAVSVGGKSITVTCALCHQDAKVRQDVTCTTCHTSAGTNAAGPSPVDLGPAHAGKLAGANWKASGAPTPQCLLCHAVDFVEKVAAHGQGSPAFPSEQGVPFVIAVGSANHFAVCESCHTAQGTGPLLKRPRTDFAARTCNGCHSEAKDRLVTNHALLAVPIADTEGPQGAALPGHAAQCLTCHPSGETAPPEVAFTHPIFPVSSGPHALGAPAVHAPGKFTCTSCHTALASDPARIDCTGCHTKAQLTTAGGVPFHAAVPDLTWPQTPAPQATSLFCLRCHADGQVPAQVLVSNHSAFGVHAAANAALGFDVTAGKPHDTADPQRGVTCFSCHASTVATTPPVSGLLVTDFAQRTCTACHALTGKKQQDLDALHLGVTTPAPGYTKLPQPAPPPSYSVTCTLCHASGAVDPAQVVSTHAAFFPIGAADSHGFGKVVTAAGGPVTISCGTCHLDTSARQRVTCTGCHTASGSNASATDAKGNPAALDLGPAHAGKLADSSWTAPAGATSTPQCLLCHTGDFDERLAVHGRGAPGFPADVTSPVPVTFAVAAGSLNHFQACASCHTAQTTDAVVKNPRLDFAQRTCSGCHSEAKDRLLTNHGGIAVTINDTVDGAGAPRAGHAKECLACHPDGGPAPADRPFTHPIFPVGAGSVHALGTPAVHAAGNFQCASCHTALASDASRVDCTGCHTQAQMVRGGVSFHAAVPDLTWPVPAQPQATSLLCLKCHTDSQVPAQIAVSTHSKFGVHSPVNAAIAFDVSPGTPHAAPASACFSCHLSTTATTPAVAGLAPVDFAQRTCTACHSPYGSKAQDLDGLHAAITTPAPGYTKLPAGVAPPSYSATCVLCHANGQIDAALAAQAHAPYFPIGAIDAHAYGKRITVGSGSVTVACLTCHRDPVVRQSVTCTVCHTSAGANAAGPAPVDLGPAHQGKLAGAAWQAASGAAPTPQCVQCHANDFLEKVAVHGRGAPGLPPDVTSPLVTFAIDASRPSHFVACASCHTAQVAGDPLLKNPRIDFAARTCNACHTEAKDRLVTNHSLLALSQVVPDTVDASGKAVPGHAKQCLACHPDGGAAPSTVPWTHPLFPVGPGSVHALSALAVHAPGNFQCASCHTALGSDPAQVDCTGCHTQAQMVRGGVSFHAAVPDLAWPQTPAAQATSLLCLRCHLDGAVPAQVKLSTHSKRGLHGPANAAIVFDVTAGTPHDTADRTRPMACFNCHLTTAATSPVIPGLSVTDFTQRTCTACHALTGTRPIDLDAKHVGMSTPAPGYLRVPQPVPPPSYSVTCVTCHASGLIDPALVAPNHAAFFPIGTRGRPSGKNRPSQFERLPRIEAKA